MDILGKDGKCTELSSDPALVALLAGYKETVVEGENANAIRSQVKMDGTLDDFSNAGGALQYTKDLASSLGIDESQV
jgi:hypothetical protein